MKAPKTTHELAEAPTAAGLGRSGPGKASAAQRRYTSVPAPPAMTATAPAVQMKKGAKGGTPGKGAPAGGVSVFPTELTMQLELRRYAAMFSSMTVVPRVCDDLGRKVIGWINVMGQRPVLRSIRAAGFLDPWLRGMSPKMQQRITGMLNVTDVDKSIDPKRRIKGQPNEARARRALQQIKAIQRRHDKKKERITAGVVDVLVRAVAEPRTNDPNGREGILGIYQAVQAARALLGMLQADYTSIVMSLAMSGGGPGTDIQTQNALILRAVAARYDDYAARARAKGPVPGAEDPDKAVSTFAGQIAGMQKDELIKKTSLIDLDASDGELGTKQRFTMSCGPTSAMMGRGEIDPIYAMRFRTNSNVSDNQQAHDPMADEQRRLLEKHGGASPGQPGQARALVAETQAPILRQRITALLPAATAAQRQGLLQLWRHVSGQPANAGQMATGLAHIRARHGGFPKAQLVQDMREYSLRTNIGVSIPQAEQLTQEQMGTENKAKTGTDRTSGTRTTKQLLDRVALALDLGIDVLFGVSWVAGGGHAMLMTNVRKIGGLNHFLISDPAGGKTAWISETHLLAKNLTALGLNAGTIFVTFVQVPEVPLQAEFPRPTLRRGARGKSVRELQRRLNQFAAGLEVDGRFGPITHGEVVKFQRANGLRARGVVGKKTWAKLDPGPVALNTP